MSSNLTPGLARAIVRSLSRGTTVSRGVRHIHVGHAKWLGAQEEVLTEVAEDGHSETKFVRGAYGAGKSHFIAVIQDRAREANWVTSHIECKVDQVQIDRFETLYPKIVEKLSSSQWADEESAKAIVAGDPVRRLLEQWASAVLGRAGIKSGAIKRPFDADDRVYAELQKTIFRSTLPPESAKAIGVFARAMLANDYDSMSSISAWLRGAAQSCVLRTAYLKKPDPANWKSYDSFTLKPIKRGSAQDTMKTIMWLIKAAGYAGLVLCIDEIEELAKLGTRKRQDQALQALREYVDNAGGDAGYRYLCMYLAATPEMFENESYFPRYDALATRIQPLTKDLNFRAPVVDLDRTPLTPAEMSQMAGRIRSVYSVAYGQLENDPFIGKSLDRFVEDLIANRSRVAKPRLLARLVVGELERARQSGSDYVPPTSWSSALSEAAAAIAADATAS